MATTEPDIVQLVEKLYSASDIGPPGHQAYIDLYMGNATLIMGSTVYQGHQGILKFRQAAWEKVSSRTHICKGIYRSPSDPQRDIMTYGTLDYGFKDGSTQQGIEWAGRLLLGRINGQPKIAFYQVYIVNCLAAYCCESDS